MKINLNNYELFVMDFLEGNLGSQEQTAFIRFLDEHPGIKTEISGLEDVVLVPDMEIIYPEKSRLYRKNRATILPIWRMNRIVAAAVTLLLISTAAMFIWKSRVNQVMLPSDPISSLKPEINQPKLPATRTPVPESRTLSATPRRDADVKRPESNVMAQKGKDPGRKDQIRRSSPAQFSGTKQNSVPPIEDRKVKNEEQIANGVDPAQQKNPKSEKSTPNGIEEIPSHYNVQVNTVAFLPVKSGELTTDQINLRTNTLTSLSQVKSTQEYKIHIPGEFLSETWTDVSLTNFKKKVIPEFIKNKLNL